MPSTLWTLESIKTVAIEQNQKTAADKLFFSVGFRSILMLDAIPLHKHVLPFLHLLLGLGNNT